MQSRHVHARFQQRYYFIWRTTSRADGADNLRSFFGAGAMSHGLHGVKSLIRLKIQS
jgi:hypothetical protein